MSRLTPFCGIARSQVPSLASTIVDIGPLQDRKVGNPPVALEDMDEHKIKKVTVAGVTGAIGPALIEALIEAGFDVKGLTRKCMSTAPKPEIRGAEIVEVDYQDEDELLHTLTEQDVVISTLGDTAGAVAAEHALIQVSVQAGVKRFIPSEFGSDTMNTRVRSFPFFANKLKHQELLKAAAARNPHFTYSIVITGPFLDWGLSVVPFIIDVGNCSAQLFDGGNVLFSTTRVTTLGRAVVSTLRNFDATANRTLYVHDALVTQNQLVARANHLVPHVSFSSTPVNTRTLETEAWASFKDPTADPLRWIFSFINVSMCSGEELCAFRAPDNKLLGIPELQGEELDKVLDEEITKAMAALSTRQSTAASELVDSKTKADKAFEDGKQKLVGFKVSV